MELELKPDRYDGNAAIAHLVATNVRTDEGGALIEAPLGDNDEFTIYFRGACAQVDEPVLQSAKSLLRAIGSLDNEVQASCAADCRASGLHPRNFEGELAYMTIAGDTALLHYFGTGVNTEWDERVTLKDGTWTYAGTVNPNAPALDDHRPSLRDSTVTRPGEQPNAGALSTPGPAQPPGALESAAVPSKGIVAWIRAIAICCLTGVVLTYASLAVEGRVIAECSNIGTPVYCPVLAYGFPVPFLADSQGISPLGSVARDPLSLLIGEDDMLWPRLSLSLVFWIMVALLGRLAWQRRARRRRRTSGRDPWSA